MDFVQVPIGVSHMPSLSPLAGAPLILFLAIPGCQSNKWEKLSNSSGWKRSLFMCMHPRSIDKKYRALVPNREQCMYTVVYFPLWVCASFPLGPPIYFYISWVFPKLVQKYMHPSLDDFAWNNNLETSLESELVWIVAYIYCTVLWNLMIMYSID